MSMKHELRKLLWRTGFDVSRFAPNSHSIARTRQLLRSYGVDLVIDVGANVGQFAQQIRKDVGYSGKIVSFEPLSSAFQQLKQKQKEDPQWEVFNCALGDFEGKKGINIAGDSYSSSILTMLSSHINAAPESRRIGREEIEIQMLDSIFNEISSGHKHIYLKIDTEGFESKVIKGAEKSLKYIDTVQMEMSLTRLHEDECLFPELYSLMSGKGYSLISIEPEFSDKRTGQLLQIDGIFHRL
ncbi:FkbM family methyltransferase [Candidatus Margulisiibacteriota bacterium]